jgi:hypothetical protein
VTLAPSTKLRLIDCPAHNGKLLVSGSISTVLGGRVNALYLSWKTNQVRRCEASVWCCRADGENAAQRFRKEEKWWR